MRGERNSSVGALGNPECTGQHLSDRNKGGMPYVHVYGRCSCPCVIVESTRHEWFIAYHSWDSVVTLGPTGHGTVIYRTWARYVYCNSGKGAGEEQKRMKILKVPPYIGKWRNFLGAGPHTVKHGIILTFIDASWLLSWNSRSNLQW